MEHYDKIYIPKTVAERVRSRPEVLFFSKGKEGCLYAISNLIENSIEEAKLGFGNTIMIRRYRDNSIEIVDYGRGIPVEFNERFKSFEWEKNFCHIYSDEYYKEENSEYIYSLGLLGMDLCCAQCVSEYMTAEIYRNGYRYVLEFEKGENIGGLKSESAEIQTTGTRLKFKLDNEVFTETDIDRKALHDIIWRLSICNPGIEFKFFYQEDEDIYDYVFKYPTLSDAIIECYTVDGKNVYELTTDYIGFTKHGNEYNGDIRIAIGFGMPGRIRESFCNDRYLEHGGIAVWELEKLISNSLINHYKLPDDENTKIKIDKVLECLCIFSSVKVEPQTAVSWQSGAKKAMINPIIGETVASKYGEMIEKIINDHKEEILALVE